MINFLTKYKALTIIFIFSLIIFIFKWSISFWFYQETVLTKIIFESKLTGDGAHYFPFIKFLSEFSLSESFNPLINNLKNLTIPYGTIFVQSILFNLFSYYGLIINEFFAIFIFILIFYKIFNFYFSKEFSIFSSLFLFSIPAIITILKFNNFDYFSILSTDIFTLRTHRPIYSHLIFYCFIYVIFIIDNSNLFNKTLFLILGILAGLSFTGFYYHFIVECIILFFFLIYKLKKKIFVEIYKNISVFIIFLSAFLITCLPFILNSFYAEPDYLIRNGLFTLTLNKKFFLIEYYLEKYKSLPFLFSFFFSLFILYFAIKKNFCKSLIVIPFICYLASVFAPIFFIITSPKSGLLYHFNNIVIVCYFFFIYFFFVTFLNYFFNILNKKFFIYFSLIFIILINLTFFFQIQIFKYQDIKERKIRNEFDQIVKKINQIKLKNNHFKKNIFLTFDNDFQIWLILNDVKYLNISNQTFSAKTDLMIEKDIINIFKFLGLNKNDLFIFFENTLDRWRIINYNVADFFRAKYTANSLNTYNNSKNFNSEIINFISNTSPIYSQQLAIPNEEFFRIGNDFDKITLNNSNFLKPDFIIFQKSHYVYQNLNKKKLNDYCLIFNGDFYIFYSTISEKKFCIN